MRLQKSANQTHVRKAQNGRRDGFIFWENFVNALNTDEHHAVTKTIVQMLMAPWFFDSLYCGITAAHYLVSDMKFTSAAGGTVARRHIPIQLDGSYSTENLNGFPRSTNRILLS